MKHQIETTADQRAADKKRVRKFRENASVRTTTRRRTRQLAASRQFRDTIAIL